MPVLRVTGTGPRRCVVVSAGRPGGQEGISIPLPAPGSPGGPLLVTVRMRVAEADSSTAEGPQARFSWREASEGPRYAPAPLVWRSTPRPVVQHLVFRPPPAASDLRLELLPGRPDVVVEVYSVEVHEPVPGALGPQEPLTNALAGGNFETGQRGFTVVHVVREPQGRWDLRPAQWTLARDAIEGRYSLEMPLGGRQTALVLGPALVETGTSYVLDLSYRGNRPVYAQACVYVGRRRAGCFRLDPADAWQSLQQSVSIAEEPGGVAEAFVVVNAGATPAHDAWLRVDRVGLYREGAPLAYQSPRGAAVGIIGPDERRGDWGHLIQYGNPVEFTVRVSNDGDEPLTARVYTDVVDVADRAVWSGEIEVLVPPRGTTDRVYSLPLGRGYYRIVASLWAVDRSGLRWLDRTERACGVVNLARGRPAEILGLRSEPDTCCRRLAELGFGWVVVDYGWGTGESDAASLGSRLGILPTLVAEGTGLLLRVRSASAAAADAGALAATLERLGVNVVGVTVEEDGRVMATHPAARVLPPASVHLPEDLEAELAALRTELTGTASGQQAWDLGVHVASSSQYVDMRRLPGVRAGSARRVVFDPIVEASEAVRGLVIRQWGGVRRVALDLWSTAAFDLIAGRGRDALCEYDSAPRPTLTALAYATEMLSDAVMVDWLDGPGGIRAVCFARDSGEQMALVWQPFGAAPRPLRLAGAQGAVRASNVCGQEERLATEGQDLLVPVSAGVVYLLTDPQRPFDLVDSLEAALRDYARAVGEGAGFEREGAGD